MRGFMQKPCLRLQAGFAFSQIMFLGNESPVAVKHQRPLCHLVEARKKAAEKGTADARLLWGTGLMHAGRRLSGGRVYPGGAWSLPCNTWLVQFRSPLRVWAASMLCRVGPKPPARKLFAEMFERWKSPAARDIPLERSVSGNTLRLRRERQGCGPANAGPQPVVLCLNQSQIN